MALTPSEKERWFEGLAKLSPEQLENLEKPLVRLRDELDTLNSTYPETKKFLEARGLTRVSQLDAQGKQELSEHLSNILRNIIN